MQNKILQTLLAYYRFFGTEIAKFMTRYDEAETTKIVNKFLEIAEGGLYEVKENEFGARDVYVTAEVEIPETIKKEISTLIDLLAVDEEIGEHIDEILK